MTRVELERPGYTWHYTLDEDTQVRMDLQWAPIPRIYSPPVLETGIYLLTLEVPAWFPTGLLIGKNGVHFKIITEATGCHYIFFRNGHIEIWGAGSAPFLGRMAMQNHITHVHLQNFYRGRMSPYPTLENTSSMEMEAS